MGRLGGLPEELGMYAAHGRPQESMLGKIMLEWKCQKSASHHTSQSRSPVVIILELLGQINM